MEEKGTKQYDYLPYSMDGRREARARWMPVLDVLVLPPVVGEGTIGGRCVELDAVEISTVSCAVVAVPGVTV